MLSMLVVHSPPPPHNVVSPGRPNQRKLNFLHMFPAWCRVMASGELQTSQNVMKQRLQRENVVLVPTQSEYWQKFFN